MIQTFLFVKLGDRPYSDSSLLHLYSTNKVFNFIL